MHNTKSRNGMSMLLLLLGIVLVTRRSTSHVMVHAFVSIRPVPSSFRSSALSVRQVPYPTHTLKLHDNPVSTFLAIKVLTRQTQSSSSSSLARSRRYASRNPLDNDTSSSTTSLIPSLVDAMPSGLASMVLTPMAQVLENVTDGWALNYADLTPESETTPVGVAFLLTNVAYTLVGVLLTLHGDFLLGTLTEVASVASFAYHYSQLKLGPNQPPVRIALLLDYIVAAATLATATYYLVTEGLTEAVPIEGLIGSVLAVLFLILSWVWEEGMPYIVNHGLWHLFGAYAGYVIGQAHLHTMA